MATALAVVPSAKAARRQQLREAAKKSLSDAEYQDKINETVKSGFTSVPDAAITELPAKVSGLVQYACIMYILHLTIGRKRKKDGEFPAWTPPLSAARFRTILRGHGAKNVDIADADHIKGTLEDAIARGLLEACPAGASFQYRAMVWKWKDAPVYEPKRKPVKAAVASQEEAAEESSAVKEPIQKLEPARVIPIEPRTTVKLELPDKRTLRVINDHPQIRATVETKSKSAEEVTIHLREPRTGAPPPVSGKEQTGGTPPVPSNGFVDPQRLKNFRLSLDALCKRDCGVGPTEAETIAIMQALGGVKDQEFFHALAIRLRRKGLDSYRKVRMFAEDVAARQVEEPAPKETQFRGSFADMFRQSGEDEP